MSYKPLHVETGLDKVQLVTKEPQSHIHTTTYGPQVPRHSIAISLTLAVISYCCCSALGIIPIIMVVFAYVKREHGKAQEATRMSNYSRVVSGIVIAIAVILSLMIILFFIGSAVMRYYRYHYNDYYGYDYDYPIDYVIDPPYDYYDNYDNTDQIIDEIIYDTEMIYDEIAPTDDYVPVDPSSYYDYEDPSYYDYED
ncbi:hypothetical protein LOD99_5964 [Oopsacas minuta]|uniref:DUF4190 domain-containing protein n=1 Tax=Oopsacas minuta TaxID=111878 RepID=A0AAV7JPJ0_9METZ|nr:hypothetical protein LOD99_5964 [Oopsacas minuta]